MWIGKLRHWDINTAARVMFFIFTLTYCAVDLTLRQHSLADSSRQDTRDRISCIYLVCTFVFSSSFAIALGIRTYFTTAVS